MPMKIIQIQQNSEEWLEYRKGKSGGSEFKDLYVAGLPTKTAIVERLECDGQTLTPADKRSSVTELAAMLEPSEVVELKLSATPKKRYYELIAEATARPITPNDYVDRLNGEQFSMMARGHILEPEAADAFSKKTGLKLAGDVVWEREDNPNIYISPDRYVVKDDEVIPTEAVEIKCLGNAETVKAYLTNKYPEEYEPQIIKYFVVNERLQRLYFVMYSDTIPGLELQIWAIERSQVEDRITEAKAFEDAIMKRVMADVAKIAKLGF